MSKAIGARVKCATSGIVGEIVARTEWAWRSPEVAVARIAGAKGGRG